MLIDSHCHLDFPDFSAEIDDIVARARAAGIGRMMTISTRVRRFHQVKALIERYDDVFGSVGTHCHNAAEEDDVTLGEILALAEHPKIVAIGEAGLDYHYDNSPRDVQARGFRSTSPPPAKPACRWSSTPARRTRMSPTSSKTRRGRGPFRRAALLLVRRGAGAAGGGARPLRVVLRHPDLQEVGGAARHRREVPRERLLVETDAPYLAPMPYRGQRNEPAYVANTLRSSPRPSASATRRSPASPRRMRSGCFPRCRGRRGSRLRRDGGRTGARQTAWGEIPCR